jgi:hypothetical protein
VELPIWRSLSPVLINKIMIWHHPKRCDIHANMQSLYNSIWSRMTSSHTKAISCWLWCCHQKSLPTCGDWCWRVPGSWIPEWVGCVCSSPL